MYFELLLLHYCWSTNPSILGSHAEYEIVCVCVCNFWRCKKGERRNPKSMTSLKVNTYHVANVISSSFYDFRIVSCIWLLYVPHEMCRISAHMHCCASEWQTKPKLLLYQIHFMLARHRTAVLQPIIKILLWIHIDTLHIRKDCLLPRLFVRSFAFIILTHLFVIVCF